MSHITTNRVLPSMYNIAGQMIPPNLTLQQRKTFVQGLGVVPAPLASTFAVHDRAASLVAQLLTLLERTKDETALSQAERLVTTWNAESDAFFKQA